MTQSPTPLQVFKMLHEEQERQKRALEDAEGAAKSFRKFIPLAWPIVEPAKEYISNCYHIDAMGDHLQAVAEGQIQNLMEIVPPGSAKSTVSSVMFSAWMWLRDPRWRSTWSSYDAALSTRDSVKCRDLMKSEWYQSTFSPAWKFNPVQDEKTYFYNTEKGFRMSTSVGGQGSGGRGTGHRSSCLGVDDALSTDARFSPAALEACIRWWDNVWFNRLIDMRTGSRIVIGQRVADNDLIGHLLRQGGWEVLHIPMEYNPARSRVTCIGWSDWRKEKDELMFPQLWPEAVVSELKKNMDVYQTQYQGEPTIAGGGILKAHKWNYWRPPGMNLPPVRVKMPDGSIVDRQAVELPVEFDLIGQSWDMSFSGKENSDFVVGQVIGVRGANRYLRDQARGRWGLPETIAAVRELTGRYPQAHTKLVENKANGPAVCQMLSNEVSGMIEVEPMGNKVARAAAVTPELDAGNWFLPHPMIAPWVGNPENPTESGFLAETVAFPFGANDDSIDALSQFCAYIQKANIGGLFGVSEKDIRVDPLVVGTNWPRIFGLAINWREVGAVWLCRQPDTNQHYLYAEHFAPASDPSQHAKIIIETSPEPWIVGYVHVTDQGRVERDGFAMIKKFKDLKVNVHGIPGSEETEILGFSEALRNGKLKVFGNLSRFMDQFRSVRRGETGHLPSYGVNVLRAAMLAWAAHSKMKGPPEAQKPDRVGTYQAGPPGEGNWMA